MNHTGSCADMVLRSTTATVVATPQIDTTLAGSPGEARSRAESWLSYHGDAVLVSGLTVALIVIAALSWQTWGDISNDTGYDVLAATRVVHGEFPYADFQYYYGPLPVGLLALTFAVFGSSIASAVGFGLVVSALAVAGTYSMMRVVSGAPESALAAALVIGPAFAATNFSYVLPHSVSAPVGLILLLGLVLAVSRWVHQGSGRAAIGSGVLLGCITLTRPEFAAAAVAGMALLLAIRWRNGLLSVRSGLSVVLPAVAVPVLVYGSLLSRIGAHELLFENLWPRAQLAAGSLDVLRIQAPLTIHSYVALMGATALYVGLGIVLFGSSRILERLNRRVAFAFVGCAVTLVVVAGLIRPETLRYYLNYAYEWIPLGALVVAAALTWRLGLKRRAVTASSQVDVLVAAILAVLAAKTYAAFLMLGPRAQPAVYVAPFAAYFLVRLHLGPLAHRARVRQLGAVWLTFLAVAGTAILLRDAYREEVVTGPGGSFGAAASERLGLQAATSWIHRTAAPGEPVLIAPQLSILGILADRPAPRIRQLQLLPNALPRAADQTDVIEQLERVRLRVALIDRREYPAYRSGSFGETFDRHLDAWLSREFRLDATFSVGDHYVEGWVRR